MKKLLAVAVLALVAASAAQAQTANIQATATVSTPLVLTAGSALSFGDVFPGFTRAINPLTSASAGTFTLAGQAGAQVSLTFTLPATLTGTGSPLVMTYGATAAAYGTTSTQASATPFNPATAGYLVNLSAGGAGNGYIWIGGSVSPPVGQTAGNYAGTITLAAAYTGN
jgi:opacity protein-like surface antigen